MPLLERTEALASLDEYARSVTAGQGRLVQISGEAGVGKTALVDAFHDGRDDMSWFWGACDGLFTPRALGPLFDIAAKVGGELRTACQRGAPREELFALLLDLIRERPCVLVIEDVHWADESTLDLIRFLGRRLRDTHTLLIITYRDDGLAAQHPLRVVLGELASLSSTRRITLSALSPRGVRELAHGSGLAADTLHRLTGGNPFFVTEVLSGGSEQIPQSAADAVLARAAGLSADARAALDCAALVGTRVESWVLEQVTSCSPATLDEVVASGLLVEDADGLRFRHELSRRAVEEAFPHRRRIPVHRLILTALQQHGCADEARLAHHGEQAGDTELVVRLAPSAARHAAALGAHREAAAQYERALRAASPSDAAVVAALHGGAFEQCAMFDEWERAVEHGEAALAIWRQLEDGLREGDTMRQLSSAMWRLCRGAECEQLSTRAVSTLERYGATPELARAYVQLAGVHGNRGRIAQTLAVIARAREIAEDLELPDVLSDALNTEAVATHVQGGDWEPIIERSIEIAMAAGAAAQAGRGYANQQAMYLGQNRLAESEAVYLAGAALCEKSDVSTYGYCLAGGHAETLLQLGRFAEAKDAADDLLAGATMSAANRIGVLATAGTVLARRGEHAAAATNLDEARALVDATGEGGWFAQLYPVFAEAAWLRGDEAGARHDIGVAAGFAEHETPWAIGDILTWCLRLGVATSLPAARVAEPYALQLHGDLDAAVRAWERLGNPYRAALACFDAQGDGALREAVRRFDALGAGAAAELTRRAMRGHGFTAVPAGPRAETRAHPLGLTRREREVLELVCAGRTNAQISAALFISERTVDHHVSAVLSKLGVSSRRAAAEAARRHSLGTDAQELGTRTAKHG